MKKFIISIILIFSLTTCDDFLNTQPPFGITQDKLTDLPSMRALVNGGFDGIKNYGATAIFDMLIVREMNVRNNDHYLTFFTHKYANAIYYTQSYEYLSAINQIAIMDFDKITGSQEDKDVILGEMHFIRALLYFNLNTHYELPSTGYSVPLVTKPVDVDERLSCAKASEIRELIESDIEDAISLLKNKKPVNIDCLAVKAFAARIYFYHKNYKKAYQYADEVIKSEKYIIELKPKDAFIPGVKSKENIFIIPYNSVDRAFAVGNLARDLKASDTEGYLYLNSNGELAKFLDKNDERYKAFFNDQDNVTYGSGKYTTDKMDYPLIRLPEMYLTRAEANIMVNGSVNQNDVDDINKVIDRSFPSAHISSIPSKTEMLEIIYQERVKEMALEAGDHLNNVKRLKRDIVNIKGDGVETYEEYADKITAMFPIEELSFHDLNRNK